VNPQHTRAAEGCVQNLVAAVSAPVCEAAAREAASERPALITMIGLVSRLPGRGQEGSRISHGFHVQQDALGVRVIAEVVDQIAHPRSSIDPVDTIALKPTSSR